MRSSALRPPKIAAPLGRRTPESALSGTGSRTWGRTKDAQNVGNTFKRISPKDSDFAAAPPAEGRAGLQPKKSELLVNRQSPSWGDAEEGIQRRPRQS